MLHLEASFIPLLYVIKSLRAYSQARTYNSARPLPPGLAQHHAENQDPFSVYYC